MLVESFRPGLMAGWGLDGDALRAAGNPGLVSCSVTAFGTGEAGRALPGYDFLLQAMGGLMHVTGEPDGPPLKVGAAVVDLICGLLAANGIQAALLERARTGPRAPRRGVADGRGADLAAQPGARRGWPAASRAHAARQPPPEHRPLRDLRRRRPADRGRGRQRPPVRAACARRSASAELAGDERFATNAARVEHRDELARLLGEAIAREPAAHWVAVLRAAAVPVGPINGVDEAFALADELGMEPTEEHDGVPLVRPPLRVDGERPAIRRGPPRARRARRRDPRLAEGAA